MGLFNIFKSKPVEKKIEIVEEINIEEIQKEISELLEKYNSDNLQLSEDLGILYFKLKDYDNSEKYLEEYIVIKKNVGTSYRNLLKIYNIKRREAAKSKNDKQLQYYLNKIDDMMKISKEVTRGSM